jgi:hypothetical protein
MVAFIGRIAIVAQVRTYGPFVLLLTQADEPLLVAGQLRLLLPEHFTADRIAFGE